MRILVNGIFFLVLTAFHLPVEGQIEVAAKLKYDQYLIGENITLTLETKHHPDYTVYFPEIRDSIYKLEVVNVSGNTVSVNENEIIETRLIHLTVFDSGYYIIPPLTFRYKVDGSEKLDSAKTNPLAIMVNTIPVDTKQPIKAIKDPLDMPFSIKEIWLYLLIAYVLLFFVSLYIYWKERKTNAKVGIFSPSISKPAHEIALGKLAELQEKKLWQQGNVKEYYTEVTEIIREYIERRFMIPALESTSNEIMHDLKSIMVDDELKKTVKELLFMGDLVKFAKMVPLPEDNEHSLEISYDFVRKTKPSDKLKMETANVA